MTSYKKYRLKKAASFTLMELVVTLIISSILVALAGTGIVMVNRQYLQFKDRNDHYFDINQIQWVLRKDVKGADQLYYLEDEFQLRCVTKTGEINYFWTDFGVVRENQDYALDTFTIETSDPEVLVNEIELVEEVKFNIKYAAFEYPVTLSKNYSPEGFINAMEIR